MVGHVPIQWSNGCNVLHMPNRRKMCLSLWISLQKRMSCLLSHFSTFARPLYTASECNPQGYSYAVEQSCGPFSQWKRLLRSCSKRCRCWSCICWRASPFKIFIHAIRSFRNWVFPLIDEKHSLKKFIFSRIAKNAFVVSREGSLWVMQGVLLQEPNNDIARPTLKDAMESTLSSKYRRDNLSSMWNGT